MSTGNKPDYAKIGFFIVGGIALIAAVLVWLGGMGAKKNEFIAETFFDDDVSGLDVGSSVYYRGVHVGNVREISFIGAKYGGVDAADEQKIYVSMALNAKMFTPAETGIEQAREKIRNLVAQGLRAKVSASGVTGLSHIDMNFITPVETAEERVGWRPANVFVPSHPGLLKSLRQSLTQFVDEMNKVDFGGAMSNLTGIVEDTRTLLQGVNGIVETSGGSLAETLDAVRSAAENARELARELRDNPAMLLHGAPVQMLDETR
ncbi:MAG: MCE family protein [Kiritimatiellae bacterium]|nr:MCE family protein [Kiritimatiellia bacterium]